MFDPTEDLRSNYPGIEPWVYAYLAQIPTRARPLSLMPPPYGEEGKHASGFTLPPPISRMTLGVEPGKSLDPSKMLHEVAHAMGYPRIGVAFDWEEPGRFSVTDPRRYVAGPELGSFIDAIKNYQHNPSPQFAAINQKLDKELTNPTSYLNTNPMEAYATIAELSGGDLRRMPPEFRQFYPWLRALRARYEDLAP